MKLNVAVSHKNKNSCYSKAITSMNINSFYFSLPSAAAQTSFFTIPNRQVPVSVDFKPFRVSFPFVPNRNF